MRLISISSLVNNSGQYNIFSSSPTLHFLTVRPQMLTGHTSSLFMICLSVSSLILGSHSINSSTLYTSQFTRVPYLSPTRKNTRSLTGQSNFIFVLPCLSEPAGPLAFSDKRVSAPPAELAPVLPIVNRCCPSEPCSQHH